MDKKYTTTEREQIYQSPRTTLERHGVTIDHGDSRRTNHRYDVVKTKDAVAVLPINDVGNLLLLENYRYAVNERFLELCAGLMDDGETPEIAAMRELGEEMGKWANYLRPIGSFYSSPGLMTEQIHIFLASGLIDVERKVEDMEDLRVVEVQPGDVMKMLHERKVKDSKTMIALLTYANYQTPDSWRMHD